MKPRINKFDEILMLAFSVSFDLLEILLLFLFGVGLLLNRFITVIEYFIFSLWFFFKGVNVFGSKSIMKTSSTFLGEMIPALGSLPLFSLGVWMIIKQSQKEDMEKEENDLE